ncbi:MAG: exodeoxyribonuclease [Thermoleophilaceae bacterium]|nr:exodeoxyribonuclease [Thermoleophilaceae bacterium]
MPRVLTWNVAGRVRTVDAQAAALASEPADVIALQEVRLSSLGPWRSALGRLGFPHVVSSLDGFDPLARLAPDRRLGVLIAGRAPVSVVAGPEGLPWPERVLCASTALGEVVNLHAPISSKPGEVKVLTLEAVFSYLAGASEAPRVVVGDFNTPQYESREGEVRTFARTRSGRLRPAYGERHDAAELVLVTGLLAHGYVDAFRVLHGYSRRDRSWLYPNGKMGFRLDHILVRGLRVEACEYVHEWREQRLSDHAAMWAELR